MARRDQLEQGQESGAKDPRDWKQWAFHTIEFPPAGEDEPLYVTKHILGTRKDEKTGKEIDFEYNFRFLRGVRLHNVPTFVIHSFNDQIETKYTQKRKPGKAGGNYMVSKRVKVRPIMIHENYDTKKPTDYDEVESEERENAPEYQE